MASFQTNLTTEQILTQLDSLRLAYLNGVVEVRFSDGKTQRYDSLDAILRAIEAGEDWLRQMTGQQGSRCTFAQHKRGDGPTGPTCLDEW
jgi:hypothetical protein